MGLPVWYPFPDEEAKPAPAPLLLVQAFLNTKYFEDGTDLLGDLESARTWLEQAGILSRGQQLEAPDLDRVRAIRGAIRTLVESASPDVTALEPLRELMRTNAVHLAVLDDGRITAQNPNRGDLSGHLLDLVLIIREAQEDGTWSRLRVCANPDCRWVFYDRSRNRHGNWCDMAVCGNRLKNRRLRARQAERAGVR